MAPTLLSLPLEIIEHIAALADPQEMPKLRLLNRECAEKVKRTFVREHFTERAFLLCNEDSLRTLLAIVEHDELGRALRHVAFGTDIVRDMAHECSQLEMEGLTPSGCREEKQQYLEHARLSQAQDRFLDGRGELHLLVTIFARLRTYRNPIILTLLGWDEATDRVRGRSHMENAVGWRRMTNCEGDDAIATILEALTLAMLPLTGFLVPEEGFWSSPYNLSCNKDLMKNARVVFPNLGVLQYHYDDENLEETPAGGDVADVSSLISECKALETLVLGKIGQPWSSTLHIENGPRFIEALLQQTLQSLKVVMLRGFDVPLDLLTSFAERHGLTRIDLCQCRLYIVGHMNCVRIRKILGADVDAGLENVLGAVQSLKVVNMTENSLRA